MTAPETDETVVPALVRQIGRGFVYFVVLQYSVGIAVRSVFDRVFVAAPLTTEGVVAGGVVLIVAAVLTNRTNPPQYRTVVLFSVVTLALGWLLDGLLGFQPGLAGSPIAVASVTLRWVGALLVAYAVTVETDWALVGARLFGDRQ